MALGIHSSLAIGKMLFQVSQGRVIQHSRPDLLHFSAGTHQDCLRREMKAVVQRCPRIRFQDDRQTGELVLRNKTRGCG
jgi:hypothetical protein